LRLVGGAVFADLLRALTPYRDDVVLVGGWVQALYVLELEGAGARVVRTSDIDLTISPTLEAGERPPLIDLLRAGGFKVDAYDGERGFEISKDDVDIDLLTEGPNPGEAVRIDGQPDLRVCGYPHQALLRENTRYILVGSEVDESLETPVEILIPTLPAYVMGKLLSSTRRSQRAKQAKDLAYVSELMARDDLRDRIVADLPPLLREYPNERELADQCLRSALNDDHLLSDVATQIIESSGFHVADDTPVRAQIKSRLTRLLTEGWDEAPGS